MGLDFHSKLKQWSETHFGFFQLCLERDCPTDVKDTTVQLLEEGMVSGEKQLAN